MPRADPNVRQSPPSPHFSTTCWSLVLAAGQSTGTQSRQALQTLCQLYWYPIYAYIRRRGRNAPDAQDLTQAFFAELLENQLIRAADPQRGRFRSYLLGALQYFLSHESARENALKRGGAHQTISIDAHAADTQYTLDPSHDITPEKLFERRWAITLIELAFNELREKSTRDRKQQLFDRLKAFLRADDPRDSYAAAAADLGMSESAVKVAVHRLRRQYRDLLRSKIAETVASPQDLDQEIRDLFTAVSG